METIVDYVGKLSGMIKQSLDDTRKFIGKEVIDATAGRKGLCVDRVSDFLEQEYHLWESNTKMKI